MVIKIADTLIECDVKQKTWSNRDQRFTYQAQVAPGICPVVVNPANEKISWVRGHEPKGYENFWD